MTITILRTTWIAVAILAMTDTATAGPEVLGCKTGLDVGAMTRCFQQKIDDAADNAKREMERKLEDERRKADDRVKELERSARYTKTATELEFLERLRALKLDGLHTCLVGAGNAARTQLGDSAARLANNPAVWARTTIEDAWRVVMNDATALIGDDLARLRRGEPPPTTTAAIIDAAWAKFERVGANHAGVGCVVAYLRPHLPALKAQAALAAQQVQAKLNEVWELKVRPAIYDAIASGLTTGISKLSGPETALLVKAVVAERLLDPARIRETATALEALALDPTDPAKLAKVRASIDNRKTGMDAELALEITRAVGHGYIHNAEVLGGGWLIDRGLSAISSLKDLAAEVTESACGLVPEVGAGACAFAVFAVEALIVAITSPAGRAAIVLALDKLLDASIDQALKAVRNPGGSPQPPDTKNPFATLVESRTQQMMAAFVEPYVGKVRAALDAYDRSVKNISAAAARP